LFFIYHLHQRCGLAHMKTSPEQHLAQSDPVLHRLIAQFPPPVVESTHNVFHDLVSCIVEQQIHYRSTKYTFQKVLDHAGIAELTIDQVDQLERHGLPNVRLNARKYDTLARAVDFFTRHQPNWQGLSNAEVRQQLGRIKGVGPWTMDMILLYTLQRPNIFPASDYHLKQIMSALYGLVEHPAPAELQAIAEAWAPQQSLAVRYLLAWKTTQQAVQI